MKVTYFEPISVTLPKNRIYSRLGYAQGLTKVDQRQKKNIEASIEEAWGLLDLKGAGLRVAVNKITPSEVILSSGKVFNSESLAEFLKGSEEILLTAATAGSKIVKAIKDKSAQKDITSGVIYDAVASETADAALSWVVDYFSQGLRRENKGLTLQRFSCGYGDFSLENQKIIYEMLGLKKLGVELTETYMLVPEKSVTAVSGVKPIK